MNETKCSAFTNLYEHISTRLINVSEIYCNENSIKVKSLWDTGATISCISKKVVTELSLIPFGRQEIHTPSGKGIVNTYLVDIHLPNDVVIHGVQVCDSSIGDQGIDLLVGMDIIAKGDFAVSNYRGKTRFTFRLPSFNVIDFVQQIRCNNIIGKKHGTGKRKKKK